MMKNSYFLDKRLNEKCERKREDIDDFTGCSLSKRKNKVPVA